MTNVKILGLLLLFADRREWARSYRITDGKIVGAGFGIAVNDDHYAREWQKWAGLVDLAALELQRRLI